MQTEVMKVQGMNGEGCADNITRALEAIEGVRDIQVSLAANRALVQFDERLTSPQQLHEALLHAGYRAETTPPATVKHSGCCGGCGG
jgi:copper chaperone CopZ